MPTFSYQCVDCAHCFDVLLLPREKDVAVQCPSCASTNVRRGVTAAAVLYKGSGYYSTDSGGTSSVESPPTSFSATDATACGGGCSCH